MKKLVLPEHHGHFLLIFLCCLILSAPAFSQADFKPVYRPNLQISKATGSIKIDGDLNDPGWKSAAKIDKFVERNPGDNIPPDVSTVVYVTYDNENLYVAFDCYDDPNSIRATMSQRDQWYGDDGVIVLLDTYGSAAWAYEFFVNPYGIQKDVLWSNVMGMEDSGFDLIWKSAARKTGTGYQVEIAIPFTSMRFPGQDVQTWRMDFWRNRPREATHQYSWAANDRNEQCWPCQWGTVEGIRDVQPGKGIEILPAFVANQMGEINGLPNRDVSFRNHDAEGQWSLGGKYSASSDVTIEGAYNPDFSQIESDAAQIDVNSTIDLIYPERRPYFQEGSDIFRTMFNSFYTRMVWDPQYTAKLTGRMGRNALGFLIARDNSSPYMIPLNQSNVPVFSVGKSLVTVFRASRELGRGSRVGIMLTDRRFKDRGIGSIASLDGLVRLSRRYTFDYQFIGSYTREISNPALTADYVDVLRFYGKDTTIDHGKHTIALDGEKFYGSAFITRLSRNARNLNFMIDYNQVSPSYRTETGYDPLINYKIVNPSLSYTIYFKKGLIQRLTPQLYKFNRWDFDGNVENDNTGVALNGQLNAAQISLDLGYNWGKRYHEQVRFDRLWEVSVRSDSRISDKIAAGIYVRYAKDVAYFAMAKGNSTDISAYLVLKPIDRITIEPNFAFSRMTNIENGGRYYNGYIARTRVQFQATKELSLRLVTQYNDFGRIWNMDPLLTFRLNSFSVFYAGSTYEYGDIAPIQRRAYPLNDIPATWKMTSRQYFLKVQYLFQT